MPIQWGLSRGDGFQNALAMGMHMGRQAREAADRKEYRNALSQFDPANPETLQPIMAANPEVGLRLSGQMQARQQAETQQRKADLPLLGRLLDFASKGEQQWQQALRVAQQYGIDVSGVPPQFDPQWAKSQASIIGALSTPEGQEALSTAGKQAVDMGFEPGTPAFQAKVTEIWQQGGAIPYTDASGATRLYIPGRGTPTQQPVAEGTVIENDAGERMILRNGKWEAMTGGQTVAPSATFSGGFRGVSGERVTSGYRSPPRNRDAGGVSNSYHMRRDARGNPMARDSVPPPGMSMGEYYRRLKAANPHLEVINEGDHVHMEPRG